MTETFSILFAVSAILATAACGAVGLLWALSATRQAVPLPLAISAGFALCLALVTEILPPVNAIFPSLQLSAWLVLATLVVSAGLLVGLHPQPMTTARDYVGTLKWPTGAKKRFLIVCLGSMTAGHYFLALVSHSVRDVFPWDAFTTWMYKSKAWVLDNQLTPVINTDEWLVSQTTDSIPLHASRYPDFVSLVAAWTSSLTGTWQQSAASLPWAAAGLAALLGTWGLIKAAGFSTALAFIGSFMLASLPLLDMHIALAGYADIWMTLYSGVGLASLVVWATRRRGDQSARITNDPILWVGCALLLAGTQVKLEGSLWIMIGLIFIGIELMERRFLVWFCLSVALLTAGYIFITGSTVISLGPLGQWGFSSEQIYAGSLGNYNVRLYNPLSSYFETLFLQKSFASLMPLYCIAILYLCSKPIKEATFPHLVMGGLIIIFQGVIFGVSGYSKFAEIQTATSRLVIHFLPVAILTLMTAAHYALVSANQSGSNSKVARETSPTEWGQPIGPKYVALTGLLLILVTLMSVGLLLSTNFDTKPSFAVTTEPTELQSVVGSGGPLPSGMWQFSESSQSVGVLRSLKAPPGETRFVSLQVGGASASEAIFYWFDHRSPDMMNKRSISHEGMNLFDFHSSADWSPNDVTEWGVVIPTRYFDSITVGSIGFSDTLSWLKLEGVVRPWLNPLEVSQRTLNGIPTAAESILRWQNMASLVAVTLALLGLAGGSRYRIACYSALLFVWVSADLLWMYSHARHLEERLNNTISDSELRSEGLHLTETVDSIKPKLDQTSPTLIIAAGEDYNYEIQRLAFLLLPQRVSFLRRGFKDFPRDWQGTVITYGANPEQLEAVSKEVIKRLKKPARRLTVGENFSLVHPL